MALSTTRTLLTQTGINTHQIFGVGGLDSVGVATFSNFKTGSTNVHSVGVEAAGINVLGGDTPIGTGATIFRDGGANFSGIVSATTFSGSFTGDGQNLTGLPAGLGTALSNTQTLALNKVYYTDRVLSISTTTTVDPPASASIAYTQYTDIKIEDGHDLIIKDGDELRPDVLGLSTTKTLDTNNFPDGLRGNLIGNVTGDVTGNVTGNLTGNVTGNVTGAVTPSGDVNVGSNIKLGAASGIVTTTTLNTDRIIPTGGVPTGGGGGIIQVVQNIKTDTGSSSVDGGALTNHVLTQAITPKFNTSKVLVEFNVMVSSDSAMNRLGAVLTRNGTPIGVADDTGDNKTENTVCINAPNTNEPYNLCGKFLDSPATTSSVTYGVKIRTGTSSTITIYFNRQGTESNNIYIMRGTSALTLMEISG